MCKKVAIWTYDNPQKEVKAIVRGPLAIHRTSTNFGFSETFTLTHLPSGLAIEKGWTRPLALMRLMRRIADLNWEQPVIGLRVDVELQASLRRASQEIQRAYLEA